MALNQTIKIAGIQVDVRELTVAEVRNWLVGAAADLADNDVVGQLLFDDCTVSDLTKMSSLTARQVNKLTPSELNEVREGCKAVNPHFFELRVPIMEQHPLRQNQQ